MKEYVLKGMKWVDGAAWSIAQGGMAHDAWHMAQGARQHGAWRNCKISESSFKLDLPL